MKRYVKNISFFCCYCFLFLNIIGCYPENERVKLDAPYNLTTGTITNNSVSLSWYRVNYATGYEVYQSTSYNAYYYSKATASITGTSATISGLSANTTYYFKVKATGDPKYLINSELSDGYAYATTSKIQLAAPYNLTTGTITNNSVYLWWNSVTNAIGYEVYQYSSYYETYTSTSVTTVGTSATITGLAANTNYYFKVKAIASNYSDYSDSELSDYINATTSKIQLDAPTNLTKGTITGSSIRLSWSSVNYANSYEVYQAATYNGTYSKVASITGTSATITELSANTTYYFKVKAIAGSSSSYLDSELSNYTYAITNKTQLATPTGLTPTMATANSVSFSWSSVTYASSYEVYLSTSSTGTYSKVTASITGTSATITGLSSNTTYYFKVMAIAGSSSSYSNSELSDPIDITTSRARLAASVGLTSGVE